MRLKTVLGNVAQVEVASALIYQPSKAIDLLLENGLIIGAALNVRHLLVEYIRSNCPDKYLVRIASEGWADIGSNRRVYILGKQTFGDQDGTPDFILGAGNTSTFTSVGRWGDWLQTSALLYGNPLLITMVCGALASALLTPLQRDSFFLMVVGPSSTGKSTTLKLVNSLSTMPSRLLTWAGTDNGIEAAVLEHTDRPTAIDEITQGDVNTLEKLTYLLANSAAKLRADAKGRLTKVRRTRTGILSAGEESLLDHLANAGKKARLGQYARCITIFANEQYGVFSDLHGLKTGGEFARSLEQRCQSTYGLVWPRYVEYLAEIQHQLLQKFEAAKREILKALQERDLALINDGVLERVLDTFVLFAFAGYSAVDAGIVTWTYKDVLCAIRHCFSLWLSGYHTHRKHPNDELLQQLRYLLQTHRNKLPPLSAYHDPTKPSDVGFLHQPRDRTGSVILVFPGFLHKMFCRKWSRGELDAILRNSGYLIPGPRRTPTRQVRIPGDSNLRVSFYAFDQSILADN